MAMPGHSFCSASSRCTHPAATAVQEQVGDIACPCIEFDGCHGSTESHGPPLRNRDNHVQELLGCEGWVVEFKVSDSRFTFEDAGDELERFRRSVSRHNAREVGKSRRFTHDQSMQGDRLVGKCRPQYEPGQVLQNLVNVAAADERQTCRRTQAIDNAMNDGLEERWLVVETMVERSLGYSCVFRDRLNACGAVSQGQKQVRRRVKNSLADLF